MLYRILGAEAIRSRFSLKEYVPEPCGAWSKRDGRRPHMLTRLGRELDCGLVGSVHEVSNDPSRLGSKGQGLGLGLVLGRLAGVRHKAASLGDRSNVAGICVDWISAPDRCPVLRHVAFLVA